MKTARNKEGKTYVEILSFADLKREYARVLKDRSDFVRAYNWACELFPFFVQRVIEVLGPDDLKWYFSTSELRLLFDRSGPNAVARLESLYNFKHSIGEKGSKDKEYSLVALAGAYARKQKYRVKEIGDLIRSRNLLSLEEAAAYICLGASELKRHELMANIIPDLPGLEAYSHARLDSLAERLNGRIVERLDVEYYGEEHPGKALGYIQTGTGEHDIHGNWVPPVMTAVAEGNKPLCWTDVDITKESIAYLSNGVIHSFIAVFGSFEEGKSEVTGILRRGGYSLHRWVLYPGDPHYRGFSDN